MAERPNILLIFSDQHTQRITGCYGDPVVRTPNLDRLAARGVVFDNAYTPSPLCVPARMSFLSGRHPCRQNCWTNSDPLASDIPTTAHALGAAGYRPILVGRLHAIGPDQLHGYVRREVGDHSTNWVGGVSHSLGPLAKTNDPFRESVERSGPGQSSYQLHDRDVTAAALEVLDELAAARKSGEGEPFALTVGYLLPHQPYVARPDLFAYYADKVGLPEIPLDSLGEEHPVHAAWRQHSGIEDVPEADCLRARAAYYALVEEFDEMVGQLLDRLAALGLDQNTLVIYVSDHGDQIGERGLWWKQTFYDESAKVPMILSWPGVLPEGERRNQLVNLVDLAQTMVEAAGAPALPAADGRSLLGVARDPGRPWIDETFSEYCTDGMSAWTGAEPVRQRMIRSGRWKLCYYDGARPQLFDLEADPRETRDLAGNPAHAELRAALEARLLADWDPEEIARVMAERRRDKELLRDWSRAVQPPDIHRWRVRSEDNWLAEATDT